MQITVLLAVFVRFILVSGEDVNNATDSSLFDDRLFLWGFSFFLVGCCTAAPDEVERNNMEHNSEQAE